MNLRGNLPLGNGHLKAVIQRQLLIENPEVTYPSAGSFTVTLQVFRGDTEDTEILENAIVVEEEAMPLEAAFSADTTTVQLGGTITFTEASTGSPETWAWVFEGGNPATSTEQNPQITYTTAGTYDVTLTISRGNEMMEVTKSDYITVQDDVTATARCLPTRIIEFEDGEYYETVLTYEDDRLIRFEDFSYLEGEAPDGSSPLVFDYNEAGYMSSYTTGCDQLTFNYNDDGFLETIVEVPFDDCEDRVFSTTRYDYNEYGYPIQIRRFDNGEDGTTSELRSEYLFQYENLTRVQYLSRGYDGEIPLVSRGYSYDDQTHIFTALNDLHLWGKGYVNILADLFADHEVPLPNNITGSTGFNRRQEVIFEENITYERYNEAGYPVKFTSVRKFSGS